MTTADWFLFALFPVGGAVYFMLLRWGTRRILQAEQELEDKLLELKEACEGQPEWADEWLRKRALKRTDPYATIARERLEKP